MALPNNDRPTFETRHNHADFSGASPHSARVILDEKLANAVANRNSDEVPYWKILELGCPLGESFLVTLHSSNESRKCVLTDQNLVTLLYLCREFFIEESKSVDLLAPIGCGIPNNAQSAISRLKKRLRISKDELILRDCGTAYFINVGKIEEGDGFRRCRDRLGPAMKPIIDQIINGIVETNLAENAPRHTLPAVSNLNPVAMPNPDLFDLVHTQFVSLVVAIEAGCPNGFAVGTSLHVAYATH